MEREIPKFREAKGVPNIEILVARRIATEFKKRLRLFHESEGSEIIFPLFITEYSDATGEPTIEYSDETITSLSHLSTTLLNTHDQFAIQTERCFRIFLLAYLLA